jgi:4-hydroxy 2-oxovalerate aldolase
MSKSKIKILDCTLRDGGYYNNWDFRDEVVRRYLQSVAAASIDAVEIGFRSLPQDSFLGPYAYATDEFLKSLDLPKGPIYAVMINGKDYVDYQGGAVAGIDRQFKKADQSPVQLVRIAMNFNTVAQVADIAKRLKNLGYQVAVNLMQSNGKKEAEYEKVAKDIAGWKSVDILYFADSLGNMNAAQVKTTTEALRKGWKGPLGIHTHNNKGLALVNTISAVESGIDWCDATMAGMGRGAGNVTTESVMLEMSEMGHHDGDPAMLQATVDDFTALQREYGWGPSFYYHLAARHNIHPTFVQELLGDKRYTNKQLLSVLEFLSDKEASHYSSDHVRRAIYSNHTDSQGTWDASGWQKGKEVLIVGTGPSVKRYREGIIQYVNKAKPAVLFLNINSDLPEDLATATIVSHETRILFDAPLYRQLKHPLVLPMAKFGDLIKDQLKGVSILDYGLALEKGVFEIGAKGCRLPMPLSAAYALAVATQAGARAIKVVGFDGFSLDDPRHDDMNEVFKSYSALKNSVEIISLTPTSYRISQSSIFAPVFDH